MGAIFRLMGARRNKIQSQTTPLAAKSSGRPPRRAETRCFAFIEAQLCRRRLSHSTPSPVFLLGSALGRLRLSSFDRRKCQGPLNGPKATGDQCPEGWSFYQYPGPGFAGIGNNSAEASYYTWVDQHNTLGLGNDVPVSTGNENDALLALVNGKWVILRVPYPLGFYAKGLDGRIDDPNGGWAAQGLWTTSGDRTPWLKEGGKGTTPLAVHIQLRPNPLAD